jgi:hypothetical protein
MLQGGHGADSAGVGHQGDSSDAMNALATNGHVRFPVPNEITAADGGWRVLLAFVAQWPAAAEFWCSL